MVLKTMSSFWKTHFSNTLRRIFILEGLMPVTMSFVLYFILPDNPETARFLTKSEKEFIINRLALETGSGKGRVTQHRPHKAAPRHRRPSRVEDLGRRRLFLGQHHRYNPNPTNMSN